MKNDTTICTDQHHTLRSLFIILNAFAKSGYQCENLLDQNVKDILTFTCSINKYFWLVKDELRLFLNISDDTIIIEKEGILDISGYGYEGLIDVLENNLGLAKIIKANEIIFSKRSIIDSDSDVTFISKNDMKFLYDSKLLKKGSGDIYFKTGDGTNKGAVIFQNSNDKQIYLEGEGKIYVYYNPDCGVHEHKYHNPYPYVQHIEPVGGFIAYMLINNLQDLQDINMFLHGNYALNTDIDAVATRYWNYGKGFEPLMDKQRNMPFSGKFDGNNHEVKNLYINRPNEDDVGFFGQISGQQSSPCIIKDLSLNKITVTGNHYVAGLVGDGQFCIISNVKLLNSEINGQAIVGNILGTAAFIELNQPILEPGQNNIHAEECQGYLIGSSQNTSINYDTNKCLGQCIGYNTTAELEV